MRISHASASRSKQLIGSRIDAVPEARQEGDTTIIPIVEEILFVERQLVLKEEVRIRRVRTTDHHKETVKLRYQEAVVTRHLGDMGKADTGSVSASEQTNPKGSDAIEEEASKRRNDMAYETIVAVFDTRAHAEAAVKALRAGGFADADISIFDGDRLKSGKKAVAPEETGLW